MKKIFDFLKANFVIAKWTVWYFLVVWLALKYVFGFDVFSRIYWWKFFHAHLRGFVGFTFGAFMYSIIPIYIASVLVIYRTKEPIIKIAFIDKICGYIKSKFVKEKSEPVPIAEEEKPTETVPEFEYPADLPHEMRVPFKRAKEYMALLGNTSLSTTYKTQTNTETNDPEPENESLPIPTDFDISDTLNEENNVPTFKEINFDEPSKPVEPENTMTKYLKEKNIEYETYQDFIITDKYIIYVHSDPDFWIIDEDSWFAAGKQIDSPVQTMLEMTKDEQIKPIIYFESKNIMDYDGTAQSLTDQGITVITKPEEIV